jgi:hypothetical protein
MERAAGFAHNDTAEAKLDKLDALLAQSFTPAQDAALFAEMLSLPKNGRHPVLELTSQQRRQKTMEALTAQLQAYVGGVEVGITPGRMKRWRDRPRHTLPRDPVSACLPPTPLHRCNGLRVRSLNDPHDSRLRPFNRHTLEPAAASRCEPTHPSPSAC